MVILALSGCAAPQPAVPWEGAVTVAPADGTEHVPVRQVVTVTFSSPPPDGTRVWLDGGAVYEEAWTSTTEWSGAPSEDLARGATHHVLVDVGADRVVTAFHTAGARVEAELVGRTYEMDLEDTSNLTWLAPSGGWGPLLSRSLGTTHSVLLMVSQADGDTLQLLGAAGLAAGGDVEQSPAIPTWCFDATSFADNPVLPVVAPLVSLGVDGVDYLLYDLRAVGEVAADGASIRDLHVSTLLDARPIEAAGPFDVCGSIGCTLCPEQGEGDVPGCATLEFVLAEAPWIEGLALVPTDSTCGAP
ncbi:MAG: hypothetical protein Q8P18_13125 [Pseudomonadota bacterium]|nr:hypothetical protein [Pseudomonadota bacterium]